MGGFSFFVNIDKTVTRSYIVDMKLRLKDVIKWIHHSGNLFSDTENIPIQSMVKYLQNTFS